MSSSSTTSRDQRRTDAHFYAESGIANAAFFAKHVGRVGNLRPIVNRPGRSEPNAISFPNQSATPSSSQRSTPMRTDSRELLAVGIFGNYSRLGDRIESLLRRKR